VIEVKFVELAQSVWNSPLWRKEAPYQIEMITQAQKAVQSSPQAWGEDFSNKNKRKRGSAILIIAVGL
jgi:hypothetical protein